MSHPCPRCGSTTNPKYTPSRAWCYPCYKDAANQRYTANRDVINAQNRAKRLRRLRRLDPAQLTRRQRHQLLRATLPPGLKLCPYCETPKTPGWFRRDRRRKDGRFALCRQCERECNALYRHKQHTQEETHAA